jgi:hypothetical protein
MRQGTRCQMRTSSWARSKGRGGSTAASTSWNRRLGVMATATVRTARLAPSGRRHSLRIAHAVSRARSEIPRSILSPCHVRPWVSAVPLPVARCDAQARHVPTFEVRRQVRPIASTSFASAACGPVRPLRMVARACCPERRRSRYRMTGHLDSLARSLGRPAATQRSYACVFKTDASAGRLVTSAAAVPASNEMQPACD